MLVLENRTINEVGGEHWGKSLVDNLLQEIPMTELF